MKHAIMVMGHGEGKVLQETINVLDDEKIDFFVHWDKKSTLPKLKSRYSKIIFIHRRKIYWGTDSQILGERSLLDAALRSKINYGYFHLISSSDMPLMTSTYFKSFFQGKSHVGFVDKVSKLQRERILWYYPIRNINVRSRINFHIIIQPLRFINHLLGVNRNQESLPIEKGTNWFSITRPLAMEINGYKYFNRFLHTYLGDELYIQSILFRLKKSKIEKDDNEQAARYIDWKRGNPFTFQLTNTEELSDLVNTKYAFARKIMDYQVVKKVFRNLV